MDNEVNYLIGSEALARLSAEIFVKAGVNAKDAKAVADSLVEANLRGTDSHGVLRIENYVKRLQQGGTVANQPCLIVAETPTTILVDAQNGLGAAVSTQVCEMVREKALKHNLAFGVVRNSNHFGAASRWALQLAGDNMIGLSGSNVECVVAAIGGKGPAVGNNPCAVAVPAERYEPICLDMASSVVAWGKVMEHRHKNKPIPLGWFLDENGEDTTDPFKAKLGLPFGGHKGFGVAVIVEALSSLLAGGAFGQGIGSQYADLTRGNLLSHYYIAVRIDSFRDLAGFKADVDAFIDHLKNSPRKDGVTDIYYPGELEAQRKIVNLRNGLKLPKSVAEELQKLARELGVDEQLIAPLTANQAA